MNLLPGGVENGRCHVCFKFTTGSSRTCRTPPRAVLLHADPAIMGLLRVPGSWIWSLRFTATSMAAWKWNPICSSNETLGEWRRVIPNRQFPNRRMEIGPFFEFFFSALGATKTAIFLPLLPRSGRSIAAIACAPMEMRSYITASKEIVTQKIGSSTLKWLKYIILSVDVCIIYGIAAIFGKLTWLPRTSPCSRGKSSRLDILFKKPSHVERGVLLVWPKSPSGSDGSVMFPTNLLVKTRVDSPYFLEISSLLIIGLV